LTNNPIQLAPEDLLGLENLEKLNGKLGIDPDTKRKLLQFLKSCKKQKVSYDLRIPFYKLLCNDQESFALNILLKALSFRNQAVQSNALKSVIENYNERKPLEKGAVLAFAGKTHFKIEEIISRLSNAGIRIERLISEKTTHVVLGFYPENHELLLEKRFTFLSERELNAFLMMASTEDLRDLDALGLEKIRALLSSGRYENIEIAIHLLKGVKIHESILTEIFIAYKTSTNKKQKTKLRSILELRLPEPYTKLLNSSLGVLGNIGPEKLNKAGLNSKKIARFISRKVDS
jgi:hypothetical protein